jgi:hypothetical protein
MFKFTRFALAASLVLSGMLLPTVADAALKLHYKGKDNDNKGKGRQEFTFRTGYVQKDFITKLDKYVADHNVSDIKEIAALLKKLVPKSHGYNPFRDVTILDQKRHQDTKLIFKKNTGVFLVRDSNTNKLLYRFQGDQGNPVPVPIAGAGLPVLIMSAGYLIYRRRTVAA